MQTRYDIKPEPVTFYPAVNDSTLVVVALNATPASETREDGTVVHFYMVDHYEFTVPTCKLNKEAIKENPLPWLYYEQKQAARAEAQRMVDELRNGCPVVPVPSFREGAAVCNRASDKVMLLAAERMGGVPMFELADGSITPLTVEDLHAIMQDVAAWEFAVQGAKQACWGAIDVADSEEAIAVALADLAEDLKQ